MNVIFKNNILNTKNQRKVNVNDEARKNALLEDIEAYQASRNETVYSSILKKYYEPLQFTSGRRLSSNQKLLESYPFYYINSETLLDVFLLWQDEEEIIYLLPESRSFHRLNRLDMDRNSLKKGTSIAISAQLWEKDLEDCEQRTALDSVVRGKNIPLYLLYDPEEWQVLLQLFDLTPLVDTQRVVFLIGLNSVREYFQNDGVIFPEKVFFPIGTKKILSEDVENPYPTKARLMYLLGLSRNKTTGRNKYLDAIRELAQNKIRQMERDVRENEKYYSENKAEIDRRFVESKPRILFITGRFTTAVQYHTRDCMLTAQQLGCETALLIENDELHRWYPATQARKIAEFKPDAVFEVDAFRYGPHSKRLFSFFKFATFLSRMAKRTNSFISRMRHVIGMAIFPKEMIFITWIQDIPVHYIMDPITPLKLNNRDFIMNHFITCPTLFDVGYDRQQMIEAPIPANHHIYHPYELTQDEMNRYGADICLVCHASDVAGEMEKMANQVSEAEQPIIFELYREYHRLAYEKGIFCYNELEFESYIKNFLKKRCKHNIANTLKNKIIEHMRYGYNLAVFRQILVDWLIDAGFINIKLWGDGWPKYEKYKPYAMGPAKNGEMLSKICQASKIILGNNIGATAAARAWESMLSGAFYMSNYIPPESDAVDIRKIMKVDEELVMFYDREDLIRKVKYYLEHDEERREMARRGREVALQKMTYDSLMKRVIQFIGKRVSEAAAGQ